MKYIIKVIKKISVSFGLLYGYNMLMQSFNIPLPFNIFTIVIISLLGIPGFISLIVFYMINFM